MRAQWNRSLAFAASLCLARSTLVVPGQAMAVTHIRNESWSPEGSIPSLPQRSAVTLSFDADLTEYDAYQGVQFSLDVPEPPGNPQTLVSFFRPFLDLPHGVPATFAVTFSLACQPSGTLAWASGPACSMRYVPPGGGQAIVENIDARVVTAADITGNFCVVVCDENGAMGANPMPSDALRCQQVRGNPSHSIGVYFDPDGTVCHGTIRPDAPGMVYVLAKVADGAEGIAGAEFRFDGVPFSWRTFPVPNPEILAVGDPLGDGVTIGFPCRSASEHVVLLYSVLVLASTEEEDVRFVIEGHLLPTNREFACPYVVGGCGPTFPKYCVTGVPCMVNSTRPGECGPIVGVEQSSWSAVKKLYRGAMR